jgi:hypothetical protein
MVPKRAFMVPQLYICFTSTLLGAGWLGGFFKQVRKIHESGVGLMKPNLFIALTDKEYFYVMKQHSAIKKETTQWM